MNNDRRKFIAFASTLGTASLVFPTGVFAQVLMPDVDILGGEDYQARIKEWFFLHNADSSQQGDLKLVKILDRGSSASLQQFSLILRSRRGAEPMPSGYYAVAGEAFDFFVKHTHERKDKQYYSADFALLQ